jgi:hypothetical protein
VQGNDWENVSVAAKDLVRKLLINRQERLTAEQALRHPWFSEKGTSVLRVDLSRVGFAASRSRAFVRVSSPAETLERSISWLGPSHTLIRCYISCLGQTQAPTASVPSPDGRRFWIDSSVEFALATIMSYEIYTFVVVDHTPHDDESSAGLICVEETVSPIARPAPDYVGQLQLYSEKECRSICLQIAKCIEILHDAGIAHRNLHLENIIIDPLVSNGYPFFTSVTGCWPCT